MEFAPTGGVEAFTLIGGYGFQALGIGIMSAFGRRWPEAFARVPFISIVALHFLCAVPAMMGETFAGSFAFGFMMNLLCGAIAASYLMRLATDVRKGRRGLTFGGAYACSTLLSWLLSLIPGLQPASSVLGLAPCIALSILTAVIALVPAKAASRESDDPVTAQNTTANPQTALTLHSAGDSTPRAGLRSIVLFACLAVLLMSLVNNIGFGFPAADIASGVNLELSRLFYAVGLVVAGTVIDRSFKYGTICCVVALVMPFALMALANEPVPATIIWGLNYLLAGFFSVFRVVLFTEIASESRLVHLACLGLMVGRIGDALGTAAYLTLGANTIALISVAVVLFAAAVFVVHRLGQLILSEQASIPQRTEQDLLNEFAATYGLSARECDVLASLAHGRSNAEIAGELFVSESTVKFHVHNLLKKTGCKTRNELRGAVIGKQV